MRTALAVAAGGATGSLGRWAVGLRLPSAQDGWPWGTLVVNVTGALAMGLLLAWLTAGAVPGRHRWVRPFVATGLLGGWTTYSGLALDIRTLGGLGLVYLVTTILLGVGACLAGLAVGERMLARSDEGGAA